MALNSLKIATGGYLKRTTKAVLIIAVAGYLNYGGSPEPLPSGGGGGGVSVSNYDQNKSQREREEKIRIEDSELIAIVELTLKHFII